VFMLFPNRKPCRGIQWGVSCDRLDLAHHCGLLNKAPGRVVRGSGEGLLHCWRPGTLYTAFLLTSFP